MRFHSKQEDFLRQFKRPSGQVLKAGDPVITYVARNLEPYRGFHSFMRALPHIQAEHKHCHTVIVGGDEVSYGSKPKDANNWREKMLAEVGSRLDPTRTHFVGKLPYADYKRVLQVSAAHVYLTYPFVLSWSMLEAMASGCLVIGSDTAPVQEVLTDMDHGKLVNFFDVEALVMGALQVVASFRRSTTVNRGAIGNIHRLFNRRNCVLHFDELVRQLQQKVI